MITIAVASFNAMLIYTTTPVVEALEWLISPEGPHHKSQVAWAGEYGCFEEGYGSSGLYHVAMDSGPAVCPKKSGASYPLIVNHTKRCYVDKREVDGEIHPLPLLTMDGYRNGHFMDIVHDCDDFHSIWGRNVISVEHSAPEGFKKLSYNVREYNN